MRTFDQSFNLVYDEEQQALRVADMVGDAVNTSDRTEDQIAANVTEADAFRISPA